MAIVTSSCALTVNNGRGDDRGPTSEYAAKEATFEAAARAASNATKEGLGTTICVPPLPSAHWACLSAKADYRARRASLIKSWNDKLECHLSNRGFLSIA